MNDLNSIKKYRYDGVSDENIFQAMTEMSGYVDITPEDFKEIYNHAYEHAHNKILSKFSGFGSKVLLFKDERFG